MDEIKIFIAEDEDSQIELYTDAIDEFNVENTTVKIIASIVKNKGDAVKELKNNFYDAVFIDLNLSIESHGENIAEGNELVDLIKKSMRYPVFVVTGKENDHIKEASENNSFIELHLKDEEDITNKLLAKVKRIYDTGITKVLGGQGSLDSHLHKIFWKHLSTTLDHWLNIECTDCNIEKIISRYTLTHLYEYMEEVEGSEKILYDPAEMYICPRVKTTIRPGDIVNNKGLKYLVLTPACTIAKQCDQFQLIKIVKLVDNIDLIKAKDNIIKDKGKIKEHEQKKEVLGDDDFYAQLTKLNTSLEKKENNFKGLIGNYIGNTKGDMYHFLPEFCGLEESLVDFQDITTVEKEDINEYRGEMTVSIHFFKDIQARFSAFYARQGSPDFDKKSLTKGIMRKMLTS